MSRIDDQLDGDDQYEGHDDTPNDQLDVWLHLTLVTLFRYLR